MTGQSLSDHFTLINLGTLTQCQYVVNGSLFLSIPRQKLVSAIPLRTRFGYVDGMAPSMYVGVKSKYSMTYLTANLGLLSAEKRVYMSVSFFNFFYIAPITRFWVFLTVVPRCCRCCCCCFHFSCLPQVGLILREMSEKTQRERDRRRNR